MADRFASQGYSLKKQTRWSNDKTIIELGYRKTSWFFSVSQINYLIDLLATDKSRYFAQPRPIIVNYVSEGNFSLWHTFTLTYTPIFAEFYTKRIQRGAFVLPNLGMDSTLPQFAKKKQFNFQGVTSYMGGEKGKKEREKSREDAWPKLL